MVIAPVASSAASSSSTIVDAPVAFAVHNVNTSAVPCQPDNRDYTVRGHLVAPQSELDRPSGQRSVAVYLHGGTAGEWMWHFPDQLVPGYDYATEQAKLGHASVVLDTLGYGSSGHPQGTQVCLGSLADSYHQIVTMLRAGTYRSSLPTPPSFGRIMIGGQSAGAPIAEAEAYSFHDVDALLVMGWADPPGEKVLLTASTGASPCATGGDHANFDRSGPLGYVYVFGTAAIEEADTFYDAAPSMLAAVPALLHRDPCGLVESGGTEIIIAQAALASISVPVLLVAGDHDFVSLSDMRLQASRFTGSNDVSLATIHAAGHIAMLERQAAQFRAIINDWMSVRGF
jgi:pimeloyl-ACP methyl ester carboxylesterase